RTVALGGGVPFFFQAEDGIRDKLVTGVQTCALPIFEGPTGQLGIITATHRFNDIKRADRDRGQRRFGASGDNDIGEIVANVTKRFANRYRSAGATVRIGSADAAKSKIDRDVRMSRTAEYLHRQSGLNSARAFFQKSNVLLFRF